MNAAASPPGRPHPHHSTVKDRTPLIWAAREGHASTVRLLLAGRARWDAAEEGGKTAADWAAERGHADVLAAIADHCRRLGKLEDAARLAAMADAARDTAGP